MKRISVVLFIFFLVSFIPLSTSADSWDDGWQIGFDEGYSVGYDDGQNNLSKDAYTSVYDSGFDDGKKAGYNSGYDDGIKQSSKSGQEKDYENGYKEGYQIGYEEGRKFEQPGIFSLLFFVGIPCVIAYYFGKSSKQYTLEDELKKYKIENAKLTASRNNQKYAAYVFNLIAKENSFTPDELADSLYINLLKVNGYSEADARVQLQAAKLEWSNEK